MLLILPFCPNHTTKSGSHIRDAVDLKRTMVTVIIALLPALFYGIIRVISILFKLTSTLPFLMPCSMVKKILPMIAVSYAVGLLIEFIFAIYRGHEVNEGYW